MLFRSQPQWIGKVEESVHMSHVSSIKIDTNLIFSDVFIETTGGHNPIVCHGHTKGDAVRMKAVIEKFQNDPTSLCTPNGLTRMILSTYFAPMELVMAKDRIVQRFEWTTDQRMIYTDGRKLPTDVSLPAWNGFSVGHWEGDTLVVNSYGFHEKIGRAHV